MNNFLKTDAFEYQNLHLGTSYLLLNQDKTKMVSYVTLAMGALKIPDKENFELRGKKLKEYPKDFPNQFPALLIGQLANDKNEEGRGAAGILVDYAIKLALKYREEVGCAYIVAHVYIDKTEWYKKKGFRTYINDPKGRETVPMYLEL